MIGTRRENAMALFFLLLSLFFVFSWVGFVQVEVRPPSEVDDLRDQATSGRKDGVVPTSAPPIDLHPS